MQIVGICYVLELAADTLRQEQDAEYCVMPYSSIWEPQGLFCREECLFARRWGSLAVHLVVGD
jgi:hypothetical protein